QLFQPPFR
nr:RecName: Full=Uncharacterized protein SMPP10 [Nautilus macromphalus]